MLIPAFQLSLNNNILSGLACVGKCMHTHLHRRHCDVGMRVVFVLSDRAVKLKTRDRLWRVSACVKHSVESLSRCYRASQ